MSNMSGDVTPAKRGSEGENNTIQAEKQPKLTAHEMPPTEPKLIHSPGDEVEEEKAVRDGGISSKIVKAERREYCKIHKCFTDHDYMSCPDKDQYYIVYEGVRILDPCVFCDFDHVGAECPYLSDDDDLIV